MKQFDEFEYAFDYCRELNKPVKVEVQGETGTVFPSGAFKPDANQSGLKGEESTKAV